MPRPDRADASPFHFTYIDRVPDGDICSILDAQQGEALSFFAGIDDQRSLHRYAPGKWSIREVVAHMSDTERVFAYRAFWFARGFDTPLPGFDQDVAAAVAGAHERTWPSLVDEFQSVRQATLSLFRHLPQDGWPRRGIASDNPVTVNALAYIAAGHVAHHLAILRERYAYA
jgi:hypothetical protein